MPSIIATKRKHRKRQSYITASFIIFLSNLWHCKNWSDGWEMLQIDKSYRYRYFDFVYR